jgi:Ankyrin repeats (many copies)
MVRLFLDQGAGVGALNRSGGTPLHDAALSGNTDVINLLLDRGANVDVKERDSGATALMMAASIGRTDAVALLLRRGADPALRDHAGRTALGEQWRGHREAAGESARAFQSRAFGEKARLKRGLSTSLSLS